MVWERRQVFQVHEKENATFTATLEDSTGTPIPLAQLVTLTLTLYDVDTESIVNSRDAQNVLNTNNVTVHSTSGLVTWEMQTADNVLTTTTKATELHIALFQWTWGTSPVRAGRHEVGIRVTNLVKVS